MKKMNTKERKQFVLEKATKRSEIQSKIQEVAQKRKAFISKKRKESATDDNNTLDQVMIKAVREQAISKSFIFEVQ